MFDGRRPRRWLTSVPASPSKARDASSVVCIATPFICSPAPAPARPRAHYSAASPLAVRTAVALPSYRRRWLPAAFAAEERRAGRHGTTARAGPGWSRRAGAPARRPSEDHGWVGFSGWQHRQDHVVELNFPAVLGRPARRELLHHHRPAYLPQEHAHPALPPPRGHAHTCACRGRHVGAVGVNLSNTP